VEASPFAVVAACFLGFVFGSFATVVVHRIPRNESVVGGRSRCPTCGRTITAVENIPVVSYLIQRGRCRGCGTRILARYPLIETATALLFALAAMKFGGGIEAVVFAAFFWVLVVLTAIDLQYRLLPNRIVYPAFALGWTGLALAAVTDHDLSSLRNAATGALVFGGFFFLVAFIYPAGMGGGDVKLAFVLGTFLGYLGGLGVVVVGMFLSFVLGGVVGVVAMMVSGAGRKTKIPFGPFLALGSTVAVFLGPQIVDFYVGRL
jgi:leader peptidase (prepilin peptidase) / N-methyltransferase